MGALTLLRSHTIGPVVGRPLASLLPLHTDDEGGGSGRGGHRFLLVVRAGPRVVHVFNRDKLVVSNTLPIPPSSPSRNLMWTHSLISFRMSCFSSCCFQEILQFAQDLSHVDLAPPDKHLPKERQHVACLALSNDGCLWRVPVGLVHLVHPLCPFFARDSSLRS